MLELLWLLLTAILAWARPRHDLVAENLLLRHQLAVLTRDSNLTTGSASQLGQAGVGPGSPLLWPLA